MKQRKRTTWLRFTSMFIFMSSTFAIHATPPSAPDATPNPAPANATPQVPEQGEEVYEPKAETGMPIHQKVPPPKEEPKQEDDKNTTLKEFTKKPDSKHKGTANSVEVKKNTPIPASTTPVNVDPAPSAGPAPTGVLSSPEPSSNVDDESDTKIEANKLVDVDKKVGEGKKYNGIIWFVGVFAVLLIVVFAFT